MIKLSKQIAGDRVYAERWFKPTDPIAQSLRSLRDAREQLREGLEKEARSGTVAARRDPRTVAGAIDAWLEQLQADGLDPASRRYVSLRDDAGRWLRAGYGDRLLGTLTTADVDRQLTRWLTVPISRARKDGSTAKPRPFAASTVNKARQALMAVLDHAGLPNVAAATARANEAIYQTLSTPDRGIDMELVALILDHFPDEETAQARSRRARAAGVAVLPGPARPNVWKLRARLVATLGFPPEVIMALQPGDLQLDADPPTVFVRGRIKGYGAPDRTLPLKNPAAFEACRAFAAADAFGTFDGRNLRRRVATAVRRAKATYEAAHGAGSWRIPVDFRLYDLRHSYLTAFYKNERDERLVGHFALHAEKSIQARRYTRSAVDALALAASARMSTVLAPLRPRAPGKALPFVKKRKAGR